MAVNLGYRLSAEPAYKRSIIESGELSEEDLRYRFFLGDIELSVGDCNFGTSWGWVPILDFAIGLRWAIREMRQCSKSTFEFTESEHALSLRDASTVISISASYAECVGECTYAELNSVSLEFAERVVNDIAHVAPEVTKSEAFIRLTSSFRE
jgi:hypothetical protein